MQPFYQFLYSCSSSYLFLNNVFSSWPRGEHYLARWAINQLHDIKLLSRMVDPNLNGTYSEKSLSRFADIISLCLEVSSFPFWIFHKHKHTVMNTKNYRLKTSKCTMWWSTHFFIGRYMDWWSKLLDLLGPTVVEWLTEILEFGNASLWSVKTISLPEKKKKKKNL